MKKILLFMVGTLVAFSLSAAHISELDAQRLAVNFINGNSGKVIFKSKKMGLQQVRSANLQAENFYGFNIADGGYVVVSANSDTYEILGYADSGMLNPEDMPYNLRQWLKGYDEAIKALTGTEVQTLSAPVVTGEAIAPLLTTTWYQDAPYNQYCPTVPNKEGTTEVAPSGCVATAMAQVMYYHQWPTAACKEIPEYKFFPAYGDSITLSALPAQAFNWGDMLLSYSGVEASESQKAAVAQLMQYCGQAVRMVYAAGGSGAQETAIATAARTYFGYDKGTKPAFRDYYSISQWENMIYEELKAGRPVLYAGQSGSGGHSFVCDGYDGNGLFHINWGWGGRSDGYFRLSVLNPFNNSSIGSSISHMGYSYSQQVVLGMQPPTEGTEAYDQNIYFALVEPVKIHSTDYGVDFLFQYESLIYPKNRVVGALGTKNGDEFVPLIYSDEVDVDEESEQCPKFVFNIPPELLQDGENLLHLYAKPASGDYPWFSLASDDVCLRVVKDTEGMALSMLPEKKIEITDVYADNNAAVKPGEKTNLHINVKNLSTKELNAQVDVLFYEMGGLTLENQDFSNLQILSPSVSGIFIPSGETDEILVRTSFANPGNAAVLICETGTTHILAKGSIVVEGDPTPFYNFQVKKYNLEYDAEMGILEGVVMLNNADTRDWAFSANSNNYIHSYINDSEQVLKTYLPAGQTLGTSQMFDTDSYGPDESIHFVMEQVLGGIYKQVVLELDIAPGERLVSGVTTVTANQGPDVWYNLQGIRIPEPTTPGLYIKNHTKVLIK